MFRLSPPERLRLLILFSLVALLAACAARPILPAGGAAAPVAQTDPADGYRDSFVPGQTGNWLFEQDESASTGIANEQLAITITSPNTIQYVTLGDYTFTDFALEVDAWQRSGPVESSYGVLFRMVDGNQFYRFDITGNGLYIVERRDADGRWTRLVPDWTSTAAINQGLNVANRLKIIAAGDSLAFYVNEILLVQVTDSAYGSGAIALDAGSFGGGDLQVTFDNLVITSGTP
jgi:hypothetical protein